MLYSSNELFVVVLEKCFLLQRIFPFRVDFCNLCRFFMLKEQHYTLKLKKLKHNRTPLIMTGWAKLLACVNVK